MTHIVFFASWLFSMPFLNNKRVPFYWMTFWILLLFLAVRYDYGNDYADYQYIHEVVNRGMNAWGSSDVLFRYLNIISPNFYVMIALISILYIYAISFLLKHNLFLKQYWLAIFILLFNPYLFLIHLSGLRQTLAICFFIFAVHFAVKRKIWPYLFFVVISIGFHQSAIILLPVYFLLSQKKIKQRTMISILAVLALMIFTPLFDLVLTRILYYFPRYHHYVEEGIQNSLRTTLLSSFFFFLMLFNINKLEGKEMVYGKLGLYSTIISLLTIKLSMISRIGMYFDIFLIVAIPLVIYRLKNTASKQILCIMVIGIYVLRYYSFFQDPLWSAYYGTYKTLMDAIF